MNEKLHRFTSYYRPGEARDLELVDAPDGQWSSTPAFPSAAGGLVSTAADRCAFGRMPLDGGTADGHALLTPASVRQMTTGPKPPLTMRDFWRHVAGG